MNLEKYISTKEASALWGITDGRIRQLCIAQEIKCIKIRDRWFVDKDQNNPKQHTTKGEV